jgi:hypothetical protein
VDFIILVIIGLAVVLVIFQAGLILEHVMMPLSPLICESRLPAIEQTVKRNSFSSAKDAKVKNQMRW